MVDPKEPSAAQQMTVFQDEFCDSVSRGRAKQEALISVELQESIGNQLKAVYEQIVDEPVPDRFLKLLANLKSKQERKT